jgi:hypothetical protein
MDIRRDIDDRETLVLERDDDIHLFGNIDGESFVTLVSRGSITLDGKVDSHSVVILRAEGDIRIGAAGDPGYRKIDAGSRVTCESNHGSISLGGKVDGGSTINFTAAQDIAIGIAGGAADRKIDGGSNIVCVSHNGSITIGGKVDGTSIVSLTASGFIEVITTGSEDDRKISGRSRLSCVSNEDSIRINGKVTGESHVSLTAAEDIRIVGGDAPTDNRIDEQSQVVARAGRDIELAGPLVGKRAGVDFRVCGDILISDAIEGGAGARLATRPGGRITVRGPIRSGSTVVFWPEESLRAEGGISGASVEAGNWAGTDAWCSVGQSLAGHWWHNWPWTFGYVTERGYPRSLPELVEQVAELGEGIEAIKAVGGGWSFTEASLPCQSREDTERISMLLLGASGRVNVRGVLEGLGDSEARPMDLWPQDVATAVQNQTRYDQAATERRVSSSPHLPAVSGVKIIDTRGLASSLQAQLFSILSESARSKVSEGRFYFHVEGGITIADLNVLLDHQSPRLALQASGGSPGATLAGTIATATHGGEFRWPLLVDQVRAVHLVGPGGQEWWIEGDQSIADPEALRGIYPNVDAEHFIGEPWNAIDGLTAADALRAVVVSMGTMGAVYSVVLEVVPQYGIRQVVKPIQHWQALLEAARTTADELRARDPAANNALLGFLLDGVRNGTGIALDDNVYVDLAINPVDRRCWVTNRQVTGGLPIDSNDSGLVAGDYLASMTLELEKHSRDSFFSNPLLGRLFNFLRWGTEDWHIVNNYNQAGRLSRFVTGFPDLLAATVATANVQAVGNVVHSSGEPDRGHQFLGDILTGLLNVLTGTTEFGNSDTTGIAYKVGAIGWPNSGVPGRGIEIALPAEQAFSFLQNVLFDDLLTNVMVGENKPLVGYISIRVCPATTTLLGMQLFAPYSVMIEVVGYRSPEANALMDILQQRVLTMVREGDLSAMLHWGLENDQLTAADLRAMPVHQALREGSSFTRLSAFQAIREYLRNSAEPVFDNYFSRRLEL